MSIFNLDKFRSARLPTEEEIMSTWQGELEKPVVSITCTAFNHDLYIHDAIRGFLIQKTDFPFEVIIHDDASNDSTPQIIRDYAERYPKIIKPILQTENQYSKAPNSILTIPAHHAKGEYLAICEGDDFWLSEKKLQLQIEALKNNPDVDLSFHSAITINEKTKEQRLSSHLPENTKTTLDMAISGGGGFMPTASIIIRKKSIINLPEWFIEAPAGDYFIQVFGSINGAIYISEPMSIYRSFSENSYSSKTNSDARKYIKPAKKMLHCIGKLEQDLAAKNISTRKVNKMRARIIYQVISLSVRSKYIKGIVFAIDMGGIKRTFDIMEIAFSSIKRLFLEARAKNY